MRASILTRCERVCARKRATIQGAKSGKTARPQGIKNRQEIRKPPKRAARVRAQTRNHPHDAPAPACRQAAEGVGEGERVKSVMQVSQTVWSMILPTTCWTRDRARSASDRASKELPHSSGHRDSCVPTIACLSPENMTGYRQSPLVGQTAPSAHVGMAEHVNGRARRKRQESCSPCESRAA